MVEVVMHEREMLEDPAELDFTLRMSQAEAQQAVDALHGVRADDDWAGDDRAEEEADEPGAERFAVSVESSTRRDGDPARGSGGRR
jgi:hypothetical protein